MEGNFSLKFDSKESYEKGIESFMRILSVWKDNKETSFNRNYDLNPDVDEDQGKFILNVSLSIIEKSNV